MLRNELCRTPPPKTRRNTGKSCDTGHARYVQCTPDDTKHPFSVPTTAHKRRSRGDATHDTLNHNGPQISGIDMPTPRTKTMTHDDDAAGERRKRGAQSGNTNAMRHGLKSGKLPVGASYVEKIVNAFRRNLESATLEIKGEIDITDAAHINTAIKWETHGALARYWLRTQGDELNASDKLKFSEAIAKASDSRDRAITRLKLDEHDKPDVLDQLYAKQILTIESTDIEGAQDK